MRYLAILRMGTWVREGSARVWEGGSGCLYRVLEGFSKL